MLLLVKTQDTCIVFAIVTEGAIQSSMQHGLFLIVFHTHIVLFDNQHMPQTHILSACWIIYSHSGTFKQNPAGYNEMIAGHDDMILYISIDIIYKCGVKVPLVAGNFNQNKLKKIMFLY